MEAAVRILLAEAGEDGRAAAVTSGAAAYVDSLLAATDGYAVPLPQERASSASHQVQRAADAASASQQASQQQASQQQASQPPPPPLRYHVPFTSQCEHHMLPFYGWAHIQLPGCSSSSGDGSGGSERGGASASGRVAPSAREVAALVAAVTRRLQVQERITQQLADGVVAACGGGGASGGGGGALVVVSAAHLCMVARGVENHAGSTLTTAARGALAADSPARADFLRAVRAHDRAQAAARERGLEAA
jgi:GTP cyclohydrolase I